MSREDEETAIRILPILREGENRTKGGRQSAGERGGSRRKKKVGMDAMIRFEERRGGKNPGKGERNFFLKKRLEEQGFEKAEAGKKKRGGYTTAGSTDGRRSACC